MKTISIHQKENNKGILFAVLWASGAIAMKTGLNSSSPLTLAIFRFLLAGIIMVSFSQIFLKEKLPNKTEWLKIIVFGFLNITMYLGCLFIAIEYVSAGLMNLFVSINPILIIFFSILFLNRKVTKHEITGFLVCFIGLLIAVLPLIKKNEANLVGIILLIIGMSSYSIGSVFYKKFDLKLSNTSINAWQTLLGGVFLIPFAYLMNTKTIILNANFYISLFWLSIVISVFATLIWLNLVKKDPIKASKWLFLAPVFGYFLSYFILGEQITLYEVIGTVLVIIGLKITNAKKHQ